MSKKRKPIPRFKTESKEQAFWETHNSSDYVDWTKAERTRVANLKPSAEGIGRRSD